MGPIWMKQMTSAAPDFSELLKDIHDIIRVNKEFCLKLTKIKSTNSLGDILMQWVDDLEVPYANYCRSYIPNLNGRSDIMCNPSIINLLNTLSVDNAYDITLETLFDAPIEQLKYYKALYNRLLNSTQPGRADHRLLIGANKRLDMIMAMAVNRSNGAQDSHLKNKHMLPPLKTSFEHPSIEHESVIEIFQQQVDCSRTVDLYSGAPINHKLEITQSDNQLLLRDSFIMLPDNGPSIRVHLVLTDETLIVTRELSQSQFLLMFPPIPVTDIVVQAISIDREVVGEYLLQFNVQDRKTITVRADSREIRNTWIGADHQAPSVPLTPQSLILIVQKKDHSNCTSSDSDKIKNTATQNKPNLRNTDIFTFYSDFGGISPIDSSDDEDFYSSTIRTDKSRDTIMDIYDNHFYDFDDEPFPPVSINQHAGMKQDLANITPQSVKILPSIPNVSQTQHELSKPANSGPLPSIPKKDDFNVKTALPLNKEIAAAGTPVKDSSHIQMTYIQAPTAQMATMSISSSLPGNNNEHKNEQQDELASSSTTTPNNMLKAQNNPMPVPVNRPANGMKANDMSKPASPRAIEVQRAVIPEVMHAITQNTDDYITTSTRVEDNYNRHQNNPSTNGPYPGMPAQLPRTSSIRNNPNELSSNNPQIRGINQLQIQGSKPLPGQPIHQNMSRPHSPMHPIQHPRGPPPPMHQNVQVNKMLPSQPRPPVPYGQPPAQPRPMMQQEVSQEYMSMPPRGMGQPGVMMTSQYPYNRPMPPPPNHPQSYKPVTQQNGRGNPSPTMSPNASQTTARRPPINLAPQPPADRLLSPSTSMTHLQAGGVPSEDFSSPPHSPSSFNTGNDVRQMLFSNNQCEVFHWHNHSWYAAEDQCLLQVKITTNNRACVSVQLHSSGELYLNAWILSTTVIRQPSPTDINFSLFMGEKKENYLIHFSYPNDASTLFNLLKKLQQDVVQIANQTIIARLDDDKHDHDEEEHVDLINVPQTLKPVMQCKAKLFVKNETSNWSTFGSVTMRISQQNPSLRMLIQIENDKTKLVSAIVKSGNVEMISPKRISFLLVDETAKTSIVYMVHLREDQTGNKIYEYLRTKNAENGW
ncbi:hypothetical protein BDB01DRAFT_446792 [Pilobolus umbonatus]|nr:hypothetical protein BDB01DRAFT_446792 [Pilobolus umbonatus]